MTKQTHFNNDIVNWGSPTAWGLLKNQHNVIASESRTKVGMKCGDLNLLSASKFEIAASFPVATGNSSQRLFQHSPWRWVYPREYKKQILHHINVNPTRVYLYMNDYTELKNYNFATHKLFKNPVLAKRTHFNNDIVRKIKL